MFRSVLVPLDGTPFSEQALPLAEIVGRVAGTRLHLVGVEEPESGAPDMASYLAEIVRRLQGADIEADSAVLDGKVVQAIEDRAKQVEADLIVMVTHGRSGLERMRFGSVAEGVVSRGIAPMLLVHPGPDGASSVPEAIGSVVVALDQSAFAQSILDPLEKLGRAVGVSRYTIVHVAEGKGVGKAGWAPPSTILVHAQEQLAPLRERLGGADVDLRVITASDPSAGILGVAEEVGADLIAMTTHGMTGVRPTLVGSVAAQVLHKWNGALLVQRPSPQ
jgi:nucleotide-binding universal stress UspA family protein